MLSEVLPAKDPVNGQRMAHGTDEGLHVTFYTKAEINNAESKKHGRPIAHDKVFCKIVTPGDALSVWDQPARDVDKERFPRQWEAFQRGQEMSEDGTPLEMWTRMTPSKVLAYKAANIFTVEAVANISDANSHAMPMDFASDRLAARAYLQAAEDSAVVQRQAEELAHQQAENERLKKQIADLGAKVDQLMGASEKAPAKAAKG